MDSLESRLIWIFGTGRSGSSWLMRLLGWNSHVAVIDETGLGEHLVNLRSLPDDDVGTTFFHYNDVREDNPNYFFARQYGDAWRPLLRRLVLTRLNHHLTTHLSDAGLPADVRLVIKEPNGSHGAELIMSLLPSSSMIFLARDGRDVVDSALAATLGESWASKFGHSLPSSERFDAVKYQANLWVHHMTVVQRAFAAAPPEKRAMVHYEQLLVDTFSVFSRLVRRLQIDWEPAEVKSTIAAEAFDAIPVHRRGPTRPARAATPGLWRRNLTPEEHAAMEQIMGTKLRELGYR